ncbi:IS30 family transposase [Corynebacterium sp. 13CS0277]|nr:IS30 family transposase [Corynebacterium sp. 13CS0277]PRQ10277.1 IS30 family transposase [Corynebacterium sp. 13CS0277]
MTHVDGHRPAPAPAVAQAMLEKTIHQRFLSARERDTIQEMLCAGCSQADIARKLGRSRSTISREIANHSDAEGHYRGASAHRQSCVNRMRKRRRKLDLTNPTRLGMEVQRMLDLQMSPEQISGRLRVEYPDDEEMRISHETIYQELYLQARGGLKREVKRALRTGRVKRKPRGQGSVNRNERFKEPMVMIADRPKEADTRLVPGHWEGDLIMGEENKSAIGTVVERTSGFLLLLELIGGHSADIVAAALTKRINELPATLKRSLTWDQGSEMAMHHQVAKDTGCTVYFCDPHSPWQRGTNENTNGLLRQYFPKGTDLSRFTAEDLEWVEMVMNSRPRKRHGYLTPAEVLAKLLESD